MEKKIFEKKQYYNNDDSSKMFIFSLLLPYIISFVVGTLISFIIAGNKEVATSIENSPAYLICTSLIGPLAFALIYLLYTKGMGISFKASTITNKPSAKNIAITVFISLVTIFGLVLLINCQDQFLKVINYTLNDKLESLPMSNAGWLVLYLFVFAVLPAICEEFLFRGAILQGLRRNFSDITAIFLSALMFMLMHGNIEQSIYQFVFGVVLAWLALRTGSLACPMIAHFLNNAITVIFAYIQRNTGYEFAAFQNVWWYYVLAVVLVIVVAVIIYLFEKFVFKHKNDYDVQKEKVSKPSLFLWLGLGVAGLLLFLSTLLNFLGLS